MLAHSHLYDSPAVCRDSLRLQDEIGLRQDAENNLNTFRQVSLRSLRYVHTGLKAVKTRYSV